MPKNPGIKLSFEQLGEQVQIPREFIAAMELKETVQAVPNEVEADALSDTVIFSRIETNRINERVKHTWFKKPGNITLLDYTTEQDGQVTQNTRTLFPTGSVPPKPVGQQKINIHDLGNGWSIQEVSVEGFFDDSVPPVFVPNVFVGARYESRIPDVVPPEFAVGVPVQTTETNVAGDAKFPAPPLSTGELDHWEQQVDTFIKRVHSEGRQNIVVPKTLIGVDTNDSKQVVTVTMTYRNAGANTAPSAIQTVVVQNLGDGRVLETVRSVQKVSLHYRFVSQVEDAVPLSFKATVPTKTVETTTAGPASSDPGLGTNELVHETENIDEFTKRERVVSRPPITGAQTGKEWRGPKDGEGSEFTSIVSKTSTLGAPSQVPTSGQFILDSKVTPVSPTQSLLETSTAPSFPILTEIIQDKRTRFKITRVKSIVDNTFVPVTDSTGANYYSTKALDSERSELIRELVQVGVDASGVPDVYQQFDGMIDVQLPTELKSVTGIANPLTASADYVTIANTIVGAGYGNSSIRGQAHCKAVASVATDVTWVVREPWARDVPCTHYLFPVARTSGNLRAGNQIAMFNANMGPLGAPNLLAWPKFAPVAINIICESQRISATGEGDGAVSQSTVVDYNGVTQRNGFSKTMGAGGEVEIEHSTKFVRLPPTIHPALTIVQPLAADLQPPLVTGVGLFKLGIDTATITAQIPSPDGTVKVKGSILNAANNSSAIAATLGQTVIPAAGSFLYKFFAEPYDYDYMLVHYIVVDMADIL